MSASAGRFAPSPTGELHLGNVRTALVAWLSARSQGLDFLVRMEDLDRVTSSVTYEQLQLDALTALGLDFDGEVVRQSERFESYHTAITELTQQGRTYKCYCTRREIREAASAPHGIETTDGAYPGTCRNLTQQQRRRYELDGRPIALRLMAHDQRVEVFDEIRGSYGAVVDDVVLRRNDGVPAYNLAVVVDDAAQHVVEVVRGDDLLSSAPRQVLLQRLLGLPTPRYRHVPLVLGADGVRLAKRHGAVTLPQLQRHGIGTSRVLAILASSLGLASEDEPVRANELIARFDIHALPREPWVLPLDLQRSVP